MEELLNTPLGAVMLGVGFAMLVGFIALLTKGKGRK